MLRIGKVSHVISEHDSPKAPITTPHLVSLARGEKVNFLVLHASGPQKPL